MTGSNNKTWGFYFPLQNKLDIKDVCDFTYAREPWVESHHNVGICSDNANAFMLFLELKLFLKAANIIKFITRK